MSKAPRNVEPRGVTIQVLKQNRLLALRHYVFDHYRRNRLNTLVPGNFTAAVMAQMWNDHERTDRLIDTSSSNKVDEPAPCKDIKHFDKFDKQVKNYLMSIYGALRVPLYYVIRQTRPADAPAMDDTERLIYEARQDGPEWEEDNERVYHFLYNLILKSTQTLQEWIKGHTMTQRGRALYLAIIGNFGGPAMLSARLSAAQAVMDKCVYEGKQRSLPWDEYTSKMTGAFTDMETAGEPLSDRAKRRKLFENIKYTSNSVFNAKPRPPAAHREKPRFESTVGIMRLASQRPGISC